MGEWRRSSWKKRFSCRKRQNAYQTFRFRKPMSKKILKNTVCSPTGHLQAKAKHGFSRISHGASTSQSWIKVMLSWNSAFFLYRDILWGQKPSDIHDSCKIRALERKRRPQKHICSRAAGLLSPQPLITCFRSFASGRQKEIGCKANCQMLHRWIRLTSCFSYLQRISLLEHLPTLRDDEVILF